MDYTALIFISLWVSLLIIGIVVTVIKKAGKKILEQNTSPAGNPSTQQAGSRPQYRYDTPKPKRESKRKVAAEGSLENFSEPDVTQKTTVAAPKESADTAKGGAETDFDPEKMIVYSEILKPGYEKY